MPDPDRARADLVQLAHDLDTVDPERARVLRDALASLAEERNDFRAALAAAAPLQDRLVSLRVQILEVSRSSAELVQRADAAAREIRALRTRLDTAQHIVCEYLQLDGDRDAELDALAAQFAGLSYDENIDRAQVAALGGAR